MNRISTALLACGLLSLPSACASNKPAATPVPPPAHSAPAAAGPHTPSTAPSPSAAGVDFGREKYRLVEKKDEIVSILDNGATVIVKRVPSPVLSVRGYVHAGSIDEGRWLGGGLSHLLEHLVAGGSSRRRTEAQNRNLLQKIGNNSNAYTTYDHTAYFINTTPDHLDDAVDLITGWLLGATITPAEFNRERQVVQRELEMGKGQPDTQFWFLTMMNRYRLSPWRVPNIGMQALIQGITRDEVWAYYQKAYQPGNMIFSIAGDLDPETMLQAVQKFVAHTPPGRVMTHPVMREQKITSPRAVVATFPKLGQARYQIAWPTVTLFNKDLYALDMLAGVLSDGDSSLLIEQLRDKQHLVSSITAYDMTLSAIPGTFGIRMHLDAGKIAAAHDAILKLIDQIKTEGVAPQRLERAKAQLRAARVRGLQTSQAVASALASGYMRTGDPHFFDTYLARIEKVTPEQVRDAARKYLVSSRILTTALLSADSPRSQGLPAAVDLIRAAAPTTQAATKPAQTASKVIRSTLDNGTVLLLRRVTTAPLVAVRMYSLGGLSAENASTSGLGNLAMEMLTRGTQTRSAIEIAQFLDSTGSTAGAFCGNNAWGWTASCLTDNFPKTMELFGDIVNHPAFAKTELDPLKQRVEAAIDDQDSNWSTQASLFFKKEYYGPMNSPYQYSIIGTKKNVEKFTPDQVRHWYEARVLKAPRVLAIYGDINLDQARTLANQYIGQGPKLPAVSRRSFSPYLPPVAGQNGTPAVNVQRVEVQKTQQALAGVMIGYRADSTIGDPANFPIDVADTMASGYTYPTGYLHEILRGKGLVYVVHAYNSPGLNKNLPGSFIVYAGCDPRNVNEVVDLILQNVARLQGSPADLQPDWFKRSKQLIDITEAMSNETPAAQASSAAADELFGLGYDFRDHFAPRINAVTLAEVQSISRARLSDCVVTISTPSPKLVNIKTGPRTYTSFPPVDLTPHGVRHDGAAQ